MERIMLKVNLHENVLLQPSIMYSKKQDRTIESNEITITPKKTRQ